jgi:RNA polymerase sigma factor (TIGR02999 family)
VDRIEWSRFLPEGGVWGTALTEVAEVTRLLRAYEAGDRAAFDQLVPLVYDELRRLAHSHLQRVPGGHTLNTTGLVHEAYLKLARSPGLQLNDRGHLMAVTACAMRQVLVSRARARLRDKRGGGATALELDEARVGHEPQAERLLDLDRALGRLRECDAKLAGIFECRYFGGLSEEETAEAQGLSLRSVQRGWMRARAWLRAELEGGREPSPID